MRRRDCHFCLPYYTLLRHTAPEHTRTHLTASDQTSPAPPYQITPSPTKPCRILSHLVSSRLACLTTPCHTEPDQVLPHLTPPSHVLPCLPYQSSPSPA
jgi:hypothetical protein